MCDKSQKKIQIPSHIQKDVFRDQYQKEMFKKLESRAYMEKFVNFNIILKLFVFLSTIMCFKYTLKNSQNGLYKAHFWHLMCFDPSIT
jgi:hypothetical protein